MFIRAYPPARPPDGSALWFVFQGQEMLLREAGEGPELPRAGVQSGPAGLELQRRLFMGTLDDTPCMAGAVAETAVVDHYQKLGLRALFGLLDPQHYALAGYAWQLNYWQQTSSFCARCGGGAEPVNSGDWGKRCSACGHVTYPRLSPCIIVLVHDGERALLTHQRGWGARYGLVAGFVEPGESLEECLRREIREEVGVEVEDIRYHASQPWPFPHQLMVGFFARYRAGEIRVQDSELDGARWFQVDELPELPGKLSIARQLLDYWIASRRGGVSP